MPCTIGVRSQAQEGTLPLTRRKKGKHPHTQDNNHALSGLTSKSTSDWVSIRSTASLIFSMYGWKVTKSCFLILPSAPRPPPGSS
mmetsp:Transcript_2088/g.13481  ORF Transcript_2088/g.13481 Transcript_2088/m.13481 type:complete len:85 (-) Transcript_2088:5488-5742(-)